MRRILFIFLIFFIFNELVAGKQELKEEVTKVPEEKKEKKVPAKELVSPPAVDVQELLADLVEKEEQINVLTKGKSKYELATKIAGTIATVLAISLAGAVGLSIYNHNRGESPFKIGSSKKSDPKDDKPSPSREGGAGQKPSDGDGSKNASGSDSKDG